MNTFRVLIVFVGVVILPNLAKELPDFVQTCSRKDPKMEECVIKTIDTIKPELVKGIPEMGVPPLDPLVIPYLLFDTGEGTNFGFSANITDLTLVGAKDMKTVKAVMNPDTDVFDLVLAIPQLFITGHYKAHGRVLVVQFDGEGKMFLNASDVTLRGKLFGKRVVKKGAEHYHFDKHELVADVGGKIETMFENLFKDNPELTDSTNKMINENADVLYDELKPLVGSALSGIIVKVFNEVHGRFSNDILYPE